VGGEGGGSSCRVGRSCVILPAVVFESSSNATPRTALVLALLLLVRLLLNFFPARIPSNSTVLECPGPNFEISESHFQ